MLKGGRDPGSREGELLGTAAAGGAVPKFPAEGSGPVLGVGARSPGKARRGRGGPGGPCPRCPARSGITGRFEPTAKLARFQSEIPEEI